MRLNRRGGSFIVCLLFNLLFNFEWSIPAWICLILRAICDISLWWFVGALGFWLVSVLSGMWMVGWAAAVSSEPSPQKENKNPYSAG